MSLRDPISSASHLFVAVWALFALLLMLRLTTAGNHRRWAVGIFGASMVLLYLASALFHGLWFPTGRSSPAFRFFQRLDQSAIFLLIAGTNTPIMAVLLRGKLRLISLTAIWGLAAFAIAALWFLPTITHEWIVAINLAMGWVGFLPVRHYYRAVGWRAMNWLWLGCLLYSIGALFELTRWPVLFEEPYRFGFHEAFHIVSGAASFAFFLFILRHVIPWEQTRPCRSTRTSTRYCASAVAQH